MPVLWKINASITVTKCFFIFISETEVNKDVSSIEGATGAQTKWFVTPTGLESLWVRIYKSGPHVQKVV